MWILFLLKHLIWFALLPYLAQFLSLSKVFSPHHPSFLQIPYAEDQSCLCAHASVCVCVWGGGWDYREGISSTQLQWHYFNSLFHHLLFVPFFPHWAWLPYKVTGTLSHPASPKVSLLFCCIYYMEKELYQSLRFAKKWAVSVTLPH